MEYFAQQTVSGLAVGFVYAGIALALVIVFQGTGVLNIAQGELATLAAFLAWTFADAGVPWLLAFPMVVVLCFAIGVGLERVFIRPVEGAPELTILVVTVGLLLGINGILGLVWGFSPHTLEGPFGSGALHFGEVTVTAEQAGVAVVMSVALGVFYAFFRFTALGLAMRAVALNPRSAALLGIRVGWVLAIGWGLAAAMGAVAGMLTAPLIGLDVNLFFALLLYGLAAATLAQFNNMVVAVIGGLVVGLSQTLSAAYIGVIGNDLNLVVPFGLIVLVLIFKPGGFGRASSARV